jgi:hypothetical protein
LSFPIESVAGPIANKYCSNSSPPSSHPNGLLVEDMTYGVDGPTGPTAPATDCYGVIASDDGSDFDVNGGNLTESVLNDLWGSTTGAKQTWGATDFALLAKDEAGTADDESYRLGTRKL